MPMTTTYTGTRMHITSILDYDFMRNAFLATAIVGIVAGAVGYFLVLRGETFAGHALAHVGFPGATGAALIGLSPLVGLSRQPRMFIAVDLPEPLGPMMATNSPASTVRSIPCSAIRRAAPCPKALVTWESRMSAGAAALMAPDRAPR